jgi:hypothetical protein
LLFPSIHHVIHRLGLHFVDALHLRAGSIDDLLRPAQHGGSLRHLLKNLFAVFLASGGDLVAPGRRGGEDGVHSFPSLT